MTYSKVKSGKGLRTAAPPTRPAAQRRGLDNSHVSYEYTGLNDLKLEIVEEATHNARIVAEKFAEDADCRLGSIKTVRLGQFEVESDDVLPHMRHVRVVTTIEYYLK